MEKIINIGTWVASFLFFILTILIIISQRSAPGNLTYGFKLGFEQSLIAFYSALNKSTNNLQVEFTRNRFNEVQRVLASKNGPEGMLNLYAQIEQTQKTILNAQNPEEKSAAAQQYITLLQQVSTQLTADKQILQTNIAQSNSSNTITQINTPSTTVSQTAQNFQTTQISPTSPINLTNSTNSLQPQNTVLQPTAAPLLAQKTTQQTFQQQQPTIAPTSIQGRPQPTSALTTTVQAKPQPTTPLVQNPTTAQTQSSSVTLANNVTIVAIDKTQTKIQQTIVKLSKVNEESKKENKKEEKKPEPTEQKKNTESEKKDNGKKEGGKDK